LAVGFMASSFRTAASFPMTCTTTPRRYPRPVVRQGRSPRPGWQASGVAGATSTHRIIEREYEGSNSGANRAGSGWKKEKATGLRRRGRRHASGRRCGDRNLEPCEKLRPHPGGRKGWARALPLPLTGRVDRKQALMSGGCAEKAHPPVRKRRIELFAVGQNHGLAEGRRARRGRLAGVLQGAEHAPTPRLRRAAGGRRPVVRPGHRRRRRG
jgi:hypothetical protein